ncbi:VIT1/CCC1 transporter family protein [bacterium]|nr:VIT1/CCC1 transporter family protein [bacterium]
MSITEYIQNKILTFQKNEITEYHIYMKLAGAVRHPENRALLEKIANDELRHYQFWKSISNKEISPSRWKLWKYYLISRIFGFTFGIKLMENGEEDAQEAYLELKEHYPKVKDIIQDENEHEDALIQLLNEEKLQYIGSIVLGLNDALVELTGALAGFTLALRDTGLIALTGMITGIAAALSMAASEYISKKSEDTLKHPLKASLYTGIAYLLTVIILIFPYLILKNYYLCLGCTLIAAVMIIAFFNYYISVAKEIPFKKRFLGMAGLSLGVSAFSFLIGYLMRSVLGVDI